MLYFRSAQPPLLSSPPHTFVPTTIIDLPLVVIGDDTPPEITCPSNIAAPCVSQAPTPATNLAEFEALGGSVTDNCGPVAVTHVGDSGPFDGIIERTYQATDLCGNSDTCVQLITISPGAPTANAGGSWNVCENDIDVGVGSSPTASGGQPPYTYEWTGSGAIYLNNTTIANPTFDISAAGEGMHQVCVTVTDDNGCVSETSCSTVTVYANPTATAGNTGPVCAGFSVQLQGGPDAMSQYSWIGPNGYTSNEQNPILDPAVAGVYCLTVTDGNGCESGAACSTVTVYANPTPTITANPGTTVCDGTTVTLDAGAGYVSYLWSPGGEDTQTIDVTNAGVYSVTVRDGNGCEGGDDIEIIVYANPTPTITANPGTTVCDGTTVTLDAGAGYASYLWSPGGEDTQTIDVTNAGVYSVTVRDGNGCEGGDDIEIIVYANPTPTITADPGTEVCDGSTVTLDAGAGYVSYLWSPGGEDTQTIDVTEGGIFSVTVTDGNGCEGSDDIGITVLDNPICEITADASVCAGSAGNSAGGPAGMVDYAWTISGGSLTSGQGTDTITYTAGTGSALTIGLTVENSDGCTTYCEVEVEIYLSNYIHLEIELAYVNIPVSRCIHFELDDCTPVDVTLDFIDHDSNPATAVRAVDTIAVPCGVWSLLCAKDEQHTAWDSTTLTPDGLDYEADTLLSLDGGDTDNNGYINIHDYTFFVSVFGQYASSGGCPWNGTRDADFDNGGFVNTADFTYLSANWHLLTTCGCSGFLLSEQLSTKQFGLTLEVDVAELPVEEAEAADMNRDGVVDFRDIRIFELRNSLPTTLSDALEKETLRRNSRQTTEIRKP